MAKNGQTSKIQVAENPNVQVGPNVQFLKIETEKYKNC